MFSIAQPTFRPQPTQVAVHTPEAQKVIAERYKTKLCRNWVATGVCPYESRCMFAHDEHELRTTEMNLRDGLVSDEAIRNFKKMVQLKEHARAIARDNSSVSSVSSAQRRPTASRTVLRPHHAAAVAYTHDPYGWMLNSECGCGECVSYHNAALRAAKQPASSSKDLDLAHWAEESSRAKCEPAGYVDGVAMP